MPAENLLITASWSINSYDLTFVLGNGQSPITRALVYDSEISDVPEPVRTGYSHTGWSPSVPSTMPAYDLTVTATWSAKEYTVTYDPNKGSGSMTQSTFRYDGSHILPICLFLRTGYTFSGWSSDPSGSAEYQELSTVSNLATGEPGDESVILYAIWAPRTYIVTFDPNGGIGEMERCTFTYDSDESLPKSQFSKKGHSISGWATSSEGAVIRSDGSKVQNLSTGAPVTLYAIWSIDSYRISFIDTGDTTIDDIVQEYDSPITPPAAPVKEGYTFVRWSPIVPERMPDRDVECTAIWSINSYDLTLVFGNGDSDRILTYEYDESISLTFNLSRTGYVFSGWDRDIPSRMPAMDLTITALWTPNAYRISFVPNGGSGTIDPIDTVYDSDISLPDDGFERTGYGLIGWGVTSSDRTYDLGETVRNLSTGAPVTLYAIWSPNVYEVTFHSNHGYDEVTTRTFVYDSDVSLPTSLFAREGHSLRGWSLEPDGDIIRSEGADVDNLSDEEDVVLYAIWRIESFTISFANTGDSSVGAITQLYGTDIVPPSDPVRRGHTFNGWAPSIPSAMPGKDLTIFANWKVNSYTISFEGCDLKDVVLDYGSTLVLSDPVRTGYDFDGWIEDVPDVMPDSDLTFTASWVAKSLDVSFHGYPDLGITVTYDSAYGRLPIAKKDGYDLRGWYLDEDLTVPVSSETIVRTPTDHTLYGLFIRIWSVTVSSNDDRMGTVTGSGVYDDGSRISISAAESDGHVFTGWSDGSSERDRTIVVNSDLALTARFARLFDVTFRPIYFDEITIECHVGGSFDVPYCDGDIFGYRFAGWSNGDGLLIPGSKSTLLTEGDELQGVWEPIDYTVTFDFGDGSLRSAQYHSGDVIRVPDVPVIEGRTFVGWDSPLMTVMPCDDLRFTAVWEVSTVTYTFDTKGGTPIPEMTLRYGDDVPDIPVPRMYGHEFTGWSPALPDVVGDEDITFTANWSVGTYSITFVPGGDSSVSVYTGTFGDVVQMPSDPIREGHRFAGWSVDVPDTMPGEDMVVHAVWESVSYTIVLDRMFDRIVLTGHMGDPVVLPDGASDIAGHSFNGWSGDVPDMFPSHDLLLRGDWTPIAYRLTFDLEKDVVMEVMCGSDIPSIDVPEREGYRFVGWDAELDVMPAYDVTLIPEWVPVAHVVTFDMRDGSDPIQVRTHLGETICPPDVDAEGFVCWYPDVPDVMPDSDLTFHALWLTEKEWYEGSEMFRDDFEAIAFDIDDVTSDTFRVESEGGWVMTCSLSSLTQVSGYVVASVVLSDTYGDYLVRLRSMSGDLYGDMVVDIPYLGHVGDRAKVRMIDRDGTHEGEASCHGSNGITYLSMTASVNSLCQIIGPVDDGDDSDIPLVIPIAISVGGLSVILVGIILWRRLR